MIDTAVIKVKAGNGGDGCVSFRREKYVAKGGPNGGDGGKGGSIYFEATHNMATLADFRSKPSYKAKNGQPGMGKNQTGEDADDMVVKVPVGTLIYELDGDEEVLVADMMEHGERFLIARGGIGGRGNARFKSSTNRTPRQFTRGTQGQSKEIKLEIKLIADVGLVGAPNAGKSTLVNSLTNARAKVANYPFTTLSPNLGVLELKDDSKVVVADIPGLISGASEGKGLGDEFLKHVERTRVLVHMIDPYEEGAEDLVQNAIDKYSMIQDELKGYKVDLSGKRQIVVINKIDITEVKEAFDDIKTVFKTDFDIEVLGISAVTGEGFDSLILRLTEVLPEIPMQPLFKQPKTVKKYTIENIPNKKMVYGLQEVFELE